MINLNKYYVSTEYQGASGGSEGRSGFVPKALSGDELKFLRGDGTWQTVSNGGSTTSIPTTGIHIPAPTLKWLRVSGTGQVLPDLFVSYTPTLTSTWLTPQTEVWIFVYRKPKRKFWINWSGYRYVSGYVHPVDIDRGAANTGKPLYGGDTGGKVFHTEFSFTSGGQLPQPYQQVPLTAFNPLEFYSRATNTTAQISATDFPFDWDTGSVYDIFSPRMSRGGTQGQSGKNLTTYYQFKFAIPNPDSTSKYPKLFGPPAYLKVRPKFTDGSGNPVTRGSAGSYIQFMNYASDNK